MTDKWYAMCCAPRDGTYVGLLHQSGDVIDIARWGKMDKAWAEIEPDSKVGEYRWLYVCGQVTAKDDSFSGWVPIPMYGRLSHCPGMFEGDPVDNPYDDPR